MAKGTEPVEDECSASLPSATLGTTRYRFFIFNMDEAPLDRIDAAGQIFAECETQQTDAVFAEYRGGHSAKVSCHASSAHTTRLAECCTTRQTWWSTCRALERPTLPSTTAQDLGEDSHMSAPRHTRSPSPCVRHSAKLSAAWQPPSPSGPSSTFFLPSPLFSARRRLCLVPVFWFSAKSTLPAGFGPSTLGREQYSAKTSPSVKRLSPSFSSTRQNRKFQ